MTEAWVPAAGAGIHGAYDRHAMPDEITKAAAAARRAYDELDANGGAIARQQLAERWGLSQPQIAATSARPSFPAPWLTIGGSPLYLYAEIQAWRRDELARPGRPGPAPRGAETFLQEPELDAGAARKAAERAAKHGGLANSRQLGERYGLTRQAIRGYAGDEGFPAARALARGPLYLVAEVDEWIRGRGREPLERA